MICGSLKSAVMTDFLIFNHFVTWTIWFFDSNVLLFRNFSTSNYLLCFKSYSGLVLEKICFWFFETVSGAFNLKVGILESCVCIVSMM